jgi:hypothetical protein
VDPYKSGVCGASHSTQGQGPLAPFPYWVGKKVRGSPSGAKGRTVLVYRSGGKVPGVCQSALMAILVADGHYEDIGVMLAMP